MVPSRALRLDAAAESDRYRDPVQEIDDHPSERALLRGEDALLNYILLASPKTTSTIGFERRFNPALQVSSMGEFTRPSSLPAMPPRAVNNDGRAFIVGTQSHSPCLFHLASLEFAKIGIQIFMKKFSGWSRVWSLFL
ncbi:MAG TPA: hypothetical protein VND40_01890 [Nitrososphaerales archaeon]|nr:hypothetical protein [Nitrososphaerales archaeon]